MFVMILYFEVGIGNGIICKMQHTYNYIYKTTITKNIEDIGYCTLDMGNGQWAYISSKKKSKSLYALAIFERDVLFGKWFVGIENLTYG